MFRFFCAFFLVLATSFNAFSDSFGENAVERQLPFKKIELTSPVLNETLDIFVQVPFHYDSQFTKNWRYPVIYVLDAPVGLPLAAGVLDSLNGYNNAPQMIIVGVSTSDRNRDFLPSLDQAYEETGGGADKYLTFLEQDLIPHIDKHFRTEPFRILSGHSYGGLLVAHSFYKRPNLFQAHFANSPSLFWEKGKTVNNLLKFIENNPNHKNFLYMNMGNEGNPESESEEGVQMLKSVRSIERMLTSVAPPNLRYKFEYFTEEPHQNTPIFGVTGALRGLYPIWSIPYKTSIDGYESVLAHFKELSATYGYNIEPKEWQMYDEGNAQLAFLDNPAEAIKYFKYNIDRNPSTYDSRNRIIDAYIKLGKKQPALEHVNVMLDRDDLTDMQRKEFTVRKSKIEAL